MEIVELNIQEDHIHAILEISQKCSVSGIMFFLKGKMALSLFYRYKKIGKQYWGRHLWSRGYCVSTVGLNEDQIRKYVKWQEKQEKDAEKIGLAFED